MLDSLCFLLGSDLELTRTLESFNELTIDELLEECAAAWNLRCPSSPTPSKGSCPRPKKVAPCRFTLPAGFFSLNAPCVCTPCVIQSVCDGGHCSHQTSKKGNSQRQFISLLGYKLTVSFCFCGWVSLFLFGWVAPRMGSYFPMSPVWKLGVFILGQPASPFDIFMKQVLYLRC